MSRRRIRPARPSRSSTNPSPVPVPPPTKTVEPQASSSISLPSGPARPSLSRRHFLRGAGAALALPFLDAMRPRTARAQGRTEPARYLGIFLPCGVDELAWFPTARGVDYALPPSLQALSSVREELLVISNLRNAPAEDRGDGPGDHARGTATVLTCAYPEKAKLGVGVSVDQVLANAWSGQTRLPSLELSCERGQRVGACDSGYPCAYQSHISWAGPRSPLPPEHAPRAVFDRLFAGFDPHAIQAQIAARRAKEQSVLDFVLDDAAALRRVVSTADQARVDEYLTGVRELERRVASLGEPPACTVPDRPDGASADPTEYLRQMADLVVLAFRCDLTRVATWMLGLGASQRSYGFLGHPGTHHEYSHHQRHEDKLLALRAINRWEVEQIAYLAQKLRDTPTDDGNLLQSTLVFVGSEIGDGNRHNHDRQPVLLLGRGRGGGGPGVVPGRHLVAELDRPVADLHLSVLTTLGVTQPLFGEDGSGLIEELYAT